MGFYIYISFDKLINHGDDRNTTDYGLLDLVELGSINYNETDLFNFFVLRKQVPVDTHLFLTDELATYIDVSYRQSVINWYKKEGEGRY